MGPEPIIMFIGGTHLVAALLLWGDSMSASYDGQLKWRERFHMDDNAVHRLGRSVIRAGVSLPIVLLYALAPKPGSAALAVGLPALLLVIVGLRGLTQVKTWGVLALGAASGLLLAFAAFQHGSAVMLPTLSGALLASAALPFAAPMLRYVRA
jgi:hypothetical protein